MNFISYSQFHDHLSRQPVGKVVNYFYSRSRLRSEAHMGTVRRCNAHNADLEMRMYAYVGGKRCRTDPRSYKVFGDWIYVGVCSAYSCHNPSLSFMIIGDGDPDWVNTQTSSTIVI